MWFASASSGLSSKSLNEWVCSFEAYLSSWLCSDGIKVYGMSVNELYECAWVNVA